MSLIRVILLNAQLLTVAHLCLPWCHYCVDIALTVNIGGCIRLLHYPSVATSLGLTRLTGWCVFVQLFDDISDRLLCYVQPFDGVSDRLLCYVQLFQALSLPAVRRSVFPVVSLMLLGFQQSPAAFLKVRTGDISHSSLTWNDCKLIVDG